MNEPYKRPNNSDLHFMVLDSRSRELPADSSELTHFVLKIIKRKDLILMSRNLLNLRNLNEVTSGAG